MRTVEIKLGLEDPHYKKIVIKEERDESYILEDEVQKTFFAYHENGKPFGLYSFIQTTGLEFYESVAILDNMDVSPEGPDLQLKFYDERNIAKFKDELGYWGVLGD